MVIKRIENERDNYGFLRLKTKKKTNAAITPATITSAANKYSKGKLPADSVACFSIVTVIELGDVLSGYQLSSIDMKRYLAFWGTCIKNPVEGVIWKSSVMSVYSWENQVCPVSKSLPAFIASGTRSASDTGSNWLVELKTPIKYSNV